jgi:hypothetical protein
MSAAMPKRLLFSALVVLAFALAACHGGGSSPTPTPTPTQTPTENPTATVATVYAQYENNPYNGTIYANAAPNGCPGSTTITGSTVSAVTGTGGESPGYAQLSPLTPNTYYTFFFIPSSGVVVSTCTLNWTRETVDLEYNQ